MSDDELIKVFWATGDFSTIIFTYEEVRSLLDSTLDENGASTEYSNQGFGKYILKNKMKKSELLKLTFSETLDVVENTR